jgi:hypothetical protein
MANFLLMRSDIRLRSRADVDFIGPRRRWHGCAGDAPLTDRDLPVARPLPARCDICQHAAETKYKRPIALESVGKDTRLFEVVYRGCKQPNWDQTNASVEEATAEKGESSALKIKVHGRAPS